jgi:hypothetical protein
MKYETLPIDIEALQFLDDAVVIEEISNFVDEDISIDYSDKENPVLKGLESNLVIPIGDYIVKEANGEFYHWEKELFELTHEPIK